MRASIRQVAERAQVSRMTVSRVVRGRRNQVNDDTYERVLTAMRELNYIPVRAAVQNHHIETNVIGVVPYYRNPSRNLIDSKTYEGICETASQQGYDLFIMLRGEAEWMANREEVRFLDRRSDGFIFISPGSGEWQTALEALVQHEIPAVVCYRRDVPEGVAWIDADNENMMRLAVDCLARQGHRKIAYLGGPKKVPYYKDLLANVSGNQPSYDDIARWHYFQQGMRSLGADPGELGRITTADPDWQMSEEELRALLATGATGVVCVNDYLALQLWTLAENAGLSIPRDLSIVSVDNQAEAIRRGLTTIAFAYEDVGREAVLAWLRLLAGDSAQECSRMLPVTLHERASVAPPAAARTRAARD